MTVAGTLRIVIRLLVGAGPDLGGSVSWPGRGATVGELIERIAEAAGCPNAVAAPSRWRGGASHRTPDRAGSGLLQHRRSQILTGCADGDLNRRPVN